MELGSRASRWMSASGYRPNIALQSGRSMAGMRAAQDRTYASCRTTPPPRGPGPVGVLDAQDVANGGAMSDVHSSTCRKAVAAAARPSRAGSPPHAAAAAYSGMGKPLNCHLTALTP